MSENDTLVLPVKVRQVTMLIVLSKHYAPAGAGRKATASGRRRGREEDVERHS